MKSLAQSLTQGISSVAYYYYNLPCWLMLGRQQRTIQSWFLLSRNENWVDGQLTIIGCVVITILEEGRSRVFEEHGAGAHNSVFWRGGMSRGGDCLFCNLNHEWDMWREEGFKHREHIPGNPKLWPSRACAESWEEFGCWRKAYQSVTIEMRLRRLAAEGRVESGGHKRHIYSHLKLELAAPKWEKP